MDPVEKIYNPWNLANRRIPDAEILRVLRTYGIPEAPQRWELFRQACVHSYILCASFEGRQSVSLLPRDCFGHHGCHGWLGKRR